MQAQLIGVFVGAIALLHLYFLVLEMFLWTRPLGLKVFRLEREFALKSAALAANQGLYNGFLAAGLIWSVMHPDAAIALQLRCFFLGCVLVASVFGAATVNRRIFFIQGVPAILALLLTWIAQGATG